ncbi:MAG: class I SAM-dependent methyltransferase [Rhizobiaceae bacterium]|nr:class I SAM-dependent methyltransferase [Rhizobiaceae bacterium]
MDSADRTAQVIRTIVGQLQPGFAVRLWSGERIEPADGGTDGPTLVINDSGIVGRVLRRPTFRTLIELWVSKAVDIENGSLFDIVERRKRGGQLKAKLRGLPRWKLLREASALFFSSGRSQGVGDLASRVASGSDKEAITHHYDISNEFYQLFLDKRMLYSCGYFTDFANDIDKAQLDKLDHICRKLRLKPGETMLDIGSGWGALLIHAVKHYGVTGTGVSLSEAQTALARERIRSEGLEDRISIEVKPYTELNGRSFDKISSIGMFEHVGFAHHDEYFNAVHRLLKPGGIYLHHAITRRMKRDMRTFHRKGPGYRAMIKYIFPGAELDAIGLTANNLESHGFEVHDIENLREHYARTCRLWAERLQARFDEAIAEVGEAKARLWLLYLAGCSLGFDGGSIMIYQTVATRRAKGPSGLPPTRADLYR